MVEETAVVDMEEVESEDGNSEIDLDFEFNDDIKESLDILLSVPLVFEDDSSDEEGDAVEETRTDKTRGDSVERQLEELFVEDKDGREESASKDTGLENISDNEFDGPESGECDTSDGELPDSPSIVVTLPSTHSIDVQGAVDVSLDEEDSDIELLDEYPNKSRDYYDASPHKVMSKPEREVIIESRNDQENIKFRERKEKGSGKAKRNKTKDKKDKNKKRGESDINDEDTKRKLKLKKYVARLNQYKAKCLEYMNQISKKCETIRKDEKNKIKSENNKIRVLKEEESRLRSIVGKIRREREPSPQSSTSSKFDKSSRVLSVDDLSKRRPDSTDRERKSRSEKKYKSKAKELKEHKLKYQQYIKYLQSERERCYEEKMFFDKHKHKSKRKHRKSKSSSPEKIKERKKILPPVLSFSEFCNSRENPSPENIVLRKPTETSSPTKFEKRDSVVSVDSLVTSSSVHSHIDHVDDDKELFITYSDLVEQDKIQESKKLELDKDNEDNILEKDPELQSISVFTSVLFKGSKDSEGIPFMEEGQPPSPRKETLKPKPTFTQPSGPDELYDWNDDLSTISQSSFSPSRSPVPKLHNKSILNYLENQKERSDKRKLKLAEEKMHKSSRSRSRSPKTVRSKLKKKKKKHYSSVSVSPSPPPLKVRSPDGYKKRTSPPAYLKERWKDYPSPHERKREHYERPARSRRRSRSRTRTRIPTHHRSRSSSEERHYRRHRSPSPTMVQISVAEKRRKLKEEHERALALLRVSNSKPLPITPLSITFTSNGDNYETVRDNYDPVVMNEGSSSPSVPDVPVDTSTPALPPLPPGLPPEPPPVPPPPAASDSTVVTTYTSFVPLPNTTLMPPQHHPNDMVVPMGYPDVHQIGPPFNNWMPMGDMGSNVQHHMYTQPQMMNNYDQYSAPHQQAFPFLNQPPPPLPYQMQMPPPCHQHYRMPNQGHLSNINLISVHQEIKNINSKPVVITQLPDSPDNDFPKNLLNIHSIDSSNKCKHNPLGQNNQTVQEAINSVKKCLKTCDGMKNKDPRLAPVEIRSRSPEKFESSSSNSGSVSQYDDKKVKIKLNYQPRPVTAVDQTNTLEPEFDVESKTINTAESNDTAKKDKYIEKNCKIEGIVSKLKDTISTSSCNVEKNDVSTHSSNKERAKVGDEPYDPFNNSDENTEECVTKELSHMSTSENTNNTIQNNVTRNSKPKLSESEVKQINAQVNKSFAFVLSHSIGRKRLTPTLASINAKKTEHQNRCNLDSKPSNQSTMLQLKQKDKDTISIKSIELSDSLVNVQKDSENKSLSCKPHEPIMKNKSEEQHSLYKPRQVIQKSDLSIFQHAFKTVDNKEKEVNPDKLDKDNVPGLNVNNLHNETSKDFERDSRKMNNDKRISEVEQVADSEQKAANTHKDCLSSSECNSGVPQSSNTLDELQKLKQKSGVNILTDLKTVLSDEKDMDTTDSSCKNKVAAYFDKNQEIDTASKNSEMIVASPHLQENHKNKSCTLKDNLEVGVGDIRNQIKASLSLKTQQELLENLPKCDVEKEQPLSDVKSSLTTERRAPVLSIPTKGELKRFPTPERTDPKISKSLLQEKHSDKSKSFDVKDPKTKTNTDRSGIRVNFKEKVMESGFSKNVVESILHDFEDSNSTGSDCQSNGKDKHKHSKKNTRYPSHSSSSDISRGTVDIIDVAEVVHFTPPITSSVDNDLKISTDEMKADTGETKLSKYNEGIHRKPKLHLEDTSCTLETSHESKQADKSSSASEDKEWATGVSENNEIMDSENMKDNVNTLSKVDTCGKEFVIDKEDHNTHCRRSKRKSKNDKLSIITQVPNDLKKKEKKFFTDDEENSLKMVKTLTDPNINLETLPKTIFNESLDNSPGKEMSNEQSDVKSPIKTPNSALTKPCPLSKKSDSFIEENLPTTFVLSTDGYLIQKGFKKLQVSVKRLSSSQAVIKKKADMSSSLSEKPSSSEEYANCANVSKLNCKVSLDSDSLVKPQDYISNQNTITDKHTCEKLKVHVTKLNLSPLKEELSDANPEKMQSCEETVLNFKADIEADILEHTAQNEQELKEKVNSKKNLIHEDEDTITKPKLRKRVTFDMNVSEIKPNSYELCCDVTEKSQIENEIPDQIEKIVGINETPHAIDLMESTESEISEVDSLRLEEISSKDDQKKSKTLNSKLVKENSSNNTLLYYKGIIETLTSFQSLPLSNVQKRKSLSVTIPKAEEMPEAKVLDSPKKTVKNKKKLDIQELPDDSISVVQNENADVSLEKFVEEESTLKPLSSNKVITELDNNRYKKLKNNNSRSEQNESDNDDSVILDKELSDLAKGCLDSDSTVGGDDDSVLNFNIAASDDSTSDVNIDLIKEKMSTSKLSVNQQNKLSSPQNIKKRFSKKIKSVVKNTDAIKDLDKLKSSKGVSEDPLQSENDFSITMAEDDDEIVNNTNIVISNSEELKTHIIPDNALDTSKLVSDVDVTDDLKTECAEKRFKNSKVHKKRRKRLGKKSKIKSRAISYVEKSGEHELIQSNKYLPSCEIETDKTCQEVKDDKDTNNGSIIEENLNKVSNKVVDTVEILENNKIPSDNVLEVQNLVQEEKHNDLEEVKPNNVSPLRKIRKTKSNMKCILSDYNSSENGNKITDSIISNLKQDSELNKSSLRQRRTVKHTEEDFSHKTNHNTEHNLKVTDKHISEEIKLPQSRLRRTRTGKAMGKNVSSSYELIEKDDLKSIISENKVEIGGENKIFCNYETEEINRSVKVNQPDPIVLDISLSSSAKRTRKGKKINYEISSSNNVEIAIEVLKENDVKDKSDIESSKEKHSEKDMSPKCNSSHNSKSPVSNECNLVEDIKESFQGKKICMQKQETGTLKSLTSYEAVSNLQDSQKTKSDPKKEMIVHQTQTNQSGTPDSSEQKVEAMNQENIGEMTLNDKLKDFEECQDKIKLYTNFLKSDLMIKEDKIDTKEQLVVSRSMSTDSIDEPLIFVKQKLLSDKFEEEKPLQEEKKCEEFEEKKNLCKLNEVQNINIQGIVKTCVSDTPNSTGNTNEHKSNSCDEEKTLRNTDSDKKQSNSRVNNFSNGNSNTKSCNNASDVSSSNTLAEKSLSSSPQAKEDFNSTNKELYQTALDIYSTFSNSSINIKSKDALRKKRDKAEVDAEIKRRLAEIDELEKLARNQHANLVDKIGTRTRSKAANQNKSTTDDVVSISSDESNNSLEDTSSTICQKSIEIKKSEDVANEEPTTTQVVETEETQLEESKSKDNLQNINSNEDNLSTADLSTDMTKKVRNKKPNAYSASKSQEASSESSSMESNDNVETNDHNVPETLQTKNEILAKATINGENVTSLITIQNSGQDNENKPLSDIVEGEKNSTPLVEQKSKRARRNVVSIYQFRGSDDETTPKNITQAKFHSNCFSKNRHAMTRDKNKAIYSPEILKYEHSFQEVTVRKTRNKTSINKIVDYSIESGQKDNHCSESSEPALEPESVKSNSINEIPEPDSSTPGLNTSARTPLINSKLSPVDIPETSISSIENQSDIHNFMESSDLNSINEKQDAESTPKEVFRQPFRKSLIHRRRRRRKPMFGRHVSIQKKLVPQESEPNVMNDSSDIVSTQSEEAVSSSNSSIQLISAKTKTRRRRKTVMDLLMEDSMLSVTRDFPMSPNPYILPTFYRDIDLSSHSNKTVPSNDSSVSEHNTKESIQNHELIPKPDIIAQKLRLLEKLKSISRKSRKTRQCRTLVCYNEDSLPESLVESPVGETNPNTTDVGILPQELVSTPNANMNENESNNTSSEKIDLLTEDQINLTHCSIVTSPELRKRVRKTISKAHLKKSRNTRFVNNLKKNREENQKEVSSIFEEKFDTFKETPVETKNNFPEIQKNIHLVEINNSLLSISKSNITQDEEPSDFDKLLENKPNKTATELYSFEPSFSQNNFDDKSDDGSDNYHSACPSPLPSDSEDDENTLSKTLLKEAPSSTSILSIKPSSQILPNKILCSILKAKVGKMLPYFGDTSTDDEDLDEDIPLSIKLSKCNEIVNVLPIEGKKTKSNYEGKGILNHQAGNFPTTKKKAFKPDEPAFQHSLRKSERKITRSSVIDSSNEDSNIKTINKEEEKDNGLLPLNATSPVLLRKSTRKSRTVNLTSHEKNCIQNCNDLITETKTELSNDLTTCNNESNLDLTDKITFTKRRGRPPKAKQTKTVHNVEEKFESLNTVHTEKSLNEQDHLVHLGNNEICGTEIIENIHIIRKKGRKPRTHNMDLIKKSSIEDSCDEIKTDEDNLDASSDIFKVNQDSPKLALSDLDTAIQKSISLRRTRSRRTKLSEDPQKSGQDEMNENLQHEEDMNKEESLESSLTEITNNLSPDKELDTKRRGRKNKSLLSNNNMQVLLDDNSFGIHEGSNDNCVQIPPVAKNHELAIETTYNELPPALVKTRARRLRIQTPDNVYLEPPNLEIPYTSSANDKPSELVVDTDSALNSSSSNVILSNKRQKRKLRKALDSNIHLKGDNEHLFAVPEEVRNPLDGFENNEEENQISSSNESHLNIEEKKTLPKKRGRKIKNKMNCKKSCIEPNFARNENYMESDSEIEINIPILKDDYSKDENVKESPCLEPENLSKSNLFESENLSEECIGTSNKNDDSEVSENTNALTRESTKRPRNLMENVPVIESSSSVQTAVSEEKDEEVDENIIKKRKISDVEPVQRAVPDQISNKPSSTSYHEPSSNTSVNQAFLWNKISGFLNKTTRSVGTQVKVKNMALKGFDTSEPEVSLQSELTLPQVIKTLFEELKCIDSSFLNP